MTETSSGSAARGGKSARKGLTMQRIHTRDGVHPYDDVTWERRDVIMTNWRDGSINFEQRGVEFPDFWSVNAANIVTTKYFRGAVGTPQREWSLKQLVDRVVGVYVAAGLKNGYFATPKDAEIFDHELKHALIHQVFSFNSPVWFNVGTSSPSRSPRASRTMRSSAPPPGSSQSASSSRRRGRHQGVRRRRCDADHRDQGQRGEGRAAPSHQGGIHARRHCRSSRLACGRCGHRRVFIPWPVRCGRATPCLHVEPEVGGTDRWLMEIDRIEQLGPMEVYDIQTESGEYLSGTSGPQLLHPGRRRHDGLDPGVVQGRGPDLQGRVGRGREPVPDPVQQGAAVVGRHRERPGVVHARRRRLGGHDQVGRRHPPRGQDGRPRRRPPGRRGVHRDQGARGGQDPGPARRRVRHGPRRQGHHQRPVPER